MCKHYFMHTSDQWRHLCLETYNCSSGKLYADFFEMFETDMFHMGGDEVNLNCWNTTTEIRNRGGYKMVGGGGSYSYSSYVCI